MKDELLKGLSKEQIKKLEDCKNTEEIFALAKEEGVALTDEQLDAVSGGGWLCNGSAIRCPKCGSRDVDFYTDNNQTARYREKCNNCGNEAPQKWFEKIPSED